MRAFAISFTILGTVAMAAMATQPAELLTPDDSSGRCASCPHHSGCRCGSCREVCCPKVEEVTEEKSCWQVDCEKICVPAIRLPWEPGGSPLTLFNCLRECGKSAHSRCRCVGCGMNSECSDSCSSCNQCRHSACIRCGTVKCVNKLGEETYEEKKCETTWEIKCLSPTWQKHDHTRNDCCNELQAAQ